MSTTTPEGRPDRTERPDRRRTEVAPDPNDTRTMWERVLAGDLYKAGDDPDLAAASKRAMDLMDKFNAPGGTDEEARQQLLSELLGSVGAGVDIRPPLYVDFGSRITIGPGSMANFGLVALDVAPITIGSDVLLGPGVQLLTPTHPVDPELRRAKWEGAEPIVLEDNVWLGGGVIVLPGVTIGENTVVGAGAVVAKDLPPNVVAVGNPARIVRRLDEEA